MEICKKDWKLYLKLLPLWQERYMALAMDKYLSIINKDSIASRKYWELYEEIKKDKYSYGVMVELRKDEMIDVIRWFIVNQVITKDDLIDFSNELVDSIY